MDIINDLKSKIKISATRVVFPEGEEERIIKAASRIVGEEIAKPILLGNESKIKDLALRMCLDLNGTVIINPTASTKLETYVDEYCKDRDFPRGAARRILANYTYFGAMMVRKGDADTMVAGIATETEEVIMASELIIGMREGIDTPSSFFLMDIPGYRGTEGSLLIFADAAVSANPNPMQLADIAIASAKSAKELLGWEPRVAMLSFSTKGSAVNCQTDKVIEAVRIIREREPDLCIDGELQADAAIVPEVAAKKIEGSSPVAGRANILIFPDLNAGNISYKLVQRLAKAAAYGPFLQGFAKPVSDLSRGASVDDIIGATILVAVGVQQDESTGN